MKRKKKSFVQHRLCLRGVKHGLCLKGERSRLPEAAGDEEQDADMVVNVETCLRKLPIARLQINPAMTADLEVVLEAVPEAVLEVVLGERPT
jgi:hypothetical protein